MIEIYSIDYFGPKIYEIYREKTMLWSSNN